MRADSTLLRWVLGWLVLGLMGCRTRPMTAWDLSQPGWVVREVPAAWRPEASAPELTGELIVAGHPGGARLVQFSKQGVPVVTARRDAVGWELNSALRKGGYRAPGRPPGRLVWFHVDALPPSQPVPGSAWKLDVDAGGGWVLEDPRRGERLEAAAP